MGWLIVYMIGFVASMIVAGTVWDEGKKTLGARVGLASPVWPVTLVFGMYVLIVFLWKHTELDTRKDRT